MSGLRRITCVSCKDDRRIHMRFAVADEFGAVEFHFNLNEEPQDSLLDDGRFGCPGIEFHQASRPSHAYSDEPDHTDCSLTGGNCWHDGSSLWALERWLPGFRHGGTEWLWPELERRHAEWKAEELAKRAAPDAP